MDIKKITKVTTYMYARQPISNAQDEKREALVGLSKGINLYSVDDYVNAISTLEGVYPYFSTNNECSHAASCAYHIGLSYNLLDQSKAAISWISQAKEHYNNSAQNPFSSKENLENIQDALFQLTYDLAECYKKYGQLENAIYTFQLVITSQLADKSIENWQFNMLSYIYLSHCHFYKYDLAKARHYLMLASFTLENKKSIFSQINSVNTKAEILGGMGYCYLREGNHSKARSYFAGQAKLLWESVRSEMHLKKPGTACASFGNALQFIGACTLRESDFGLLCKAYKALKIAFKLYSDLGNEREKSSVALGLGVFSLYLNKRKDADYYCEVVLAFSKQLIEPNDLRVAHKTAKFWLENEVVNKKIMITPKLKDIFDFCVGIEKEHYHGQSSFLVFSAQPRSCFPSKLKTSSEVSLVSLSHFKSNQKTQEQAVRPRSASAELSIDKKRCSLITK